MPDDISGLTTGNNDYFFSGRLFCFQLYDFPISADNVELLRSKCDEITGMLRYTTLAAVLRNSYEMFALVVTADDPEDELVLKWDFDDSLVDSVQGATFTVSGGTLPAMTAGYRYGHQAVV